MINGQQVCTPCGRGLYTAGDESTSCLACPALTSTVSNDSNSISDCTGKHFHTQRLHVIWSFAFYYFIFSLFLLQLSASRGILIPHLEWSPVSPALPVPTSCNMVLLSACPALQDPLYQPVSSHLPRQPQTCPLMMLRIPHHRSAMRYYSPLLFQL